MLRRRHLCPGPQTDPLLTLSSRITHKEGLMRKCQGITGLIKWWVRPRPEPQPPGLPHGQPPWPYLKGIFID
ncbi:hypothetical protein HaLaN_32600 [Haematococcus lacustris]|uniref:Uncharacterized protein n=1 Tax=Haematococcus lacustris TaxID=44745 RepID=A0A6A0ANB3_HAELA|nr:hypothetical protein HaLaN_32600 [Haematococcus lacustris]